MVAVLATQAAATAAAQWRRWRRTWAGMGGGRGDCGGDTHNDSDVVVTTASADSAAAAVGGDVDIFVGEIAQGYLVVNCLKVLKPILVVEGVSFGWGFCNRVTGLEGCVSN